MNGNPDTSLTIDTHHHILPDFFWQETENAHAPSEDLRRFAGPRKQAFLSWMTPASTLLWSP
jgi:hypothetical protein